MDQMEARGQFYKCLKENSQSKQAVNLSIYPEGKGEKEEIMLHCSRQPHGGGGFGKKAQNPNVLEKKAYLAFCQYFKGDRKNELYLLE